MFQLCDASSKSSLGFEIVVEGYDTWHASPNPAQCRGSRELQLGEQVTISGDNDLLLEAVVIRAT